MSLRAWIRAHRAQGRIARRVASLLGEPAPIGSGQLVARIEAPRRHPHDGGGLTGRFGLRIDPGRRGALAVGAAAVVAVVVAGAWVLANRPRAEAIGPVGASSIAPRSSTAASAGVSSGPAAGSGRAAASAARTSPSPSPSTAIVVVDVVGKVVTPGVYRLPAGARVDDAVQAAGGALPGVDLSTLNLAQVLADGEQVAVSVVGAPAGAAAVTGAGSGSVSVTGPVNLNSATSAQLDALPGVGPVLAGHIIDWRTAHGQFTSVDQLREVSGIGDAKFADLKALVTV